jgi:predicted XRE-type DNA-binding protein
MVDPRVKDLMNKNLDSLSDDELLLLMKSTQ